MATLVIVSETAMAVEIPLPTLLPITYAPNDDSAERAESELQVEMWDLQGSGMRSRAAASRSTTDPLRYESPGVSAEAPGIVRAQEEQSEEPATPASLDELTWKQYFKALAPPWSSKQTDEEKNAHDAERGYDRLKTGRVDDFQEGMPRLAALLNSDDSFALYRKWGQLASRILLHRTIELAQLEKRWGDMDIENSTDGTKKLRLTGSGDCGGWGKEQEDLVMEVQKKLEDYYGFLLQFNHVRNLRQPPRHQPMGLFNWMCDERPLSEDMSKFVYQIDDFISVAKSDNDAYASDMLESLLDSHPGVPFKKFLQTSRELEKTDDPFMEHYSPDRFKIVVRTISVLVVVTILLVPILLLFLVPMSRQVMAGVVFGFVLGFALIMALLTEARIHQVLVGSCAYGAVLVTFMGNLDRLSGV